MECFMRMKKVAPAFCAFKFPVSYDQYFAVVRQTPILNSTSSLHWLAVSSVEAKSQSTDIIDLVDGIHDLEACAEKGGISRDEI